jgi:hypothetical protein
MSDDLRTNIRASRLHVPRSRGAVGGALLIVLGAWAALVPFIGPYFDVAFQPDPNTAWHWTADRLWLDVVPGAAAALGGLVLLLSANRVTASLGGWLAAAGGAWLVVGPALSGPLSLNAMQPDPGAGRWLQAVDSLVFYFGIGAAIVLLAGLALGRLSVHSVRDVRAAERRANAEAEREAQRLEDERRAAEAQAAAEEHRRRELARQQAVDTPTQPTPPVGGGPAGTAPADTRPADTAPGYDTPTTDDVTGDRQHARH